MTKRLLLVALIFMCPSAFADGSRTSATAGSVEASDQVFRAKFQANLRKFLVKAGLNNPEYLDPAQLGFKNADHAWRSSSNGDVIVGAWMNSMEAEPNQTGMNKLIKAYEEDCGGPLSTKKQNVITGKIVTIKSLRLSCTRPANIFHSSFITIIKAGIATVVMHESKKHDVVVNSVNDNLSNILYSVYEK